MNKGRRNIIIAAIVVSIAVAAAIGAFFAFNHDTPVEMTASEPASEEETDQKPEEPTTPPVKEIDFQPVVDAWVKTVAGNKSVLIYDLNLNKTVALYNIDESYNTASLYKLFVVYEGYKRVESKVWDGNAAAGSAGKTVLECLDLAIRESHSICAEALWGMIGRDNLTNIMESEWNITHSEISRLISNANDITLILKRFYEHPDFSDPTLLNRMWDSFLNQPVTTYDWRQGLPKGFNKASVYNKVGWDYNPDSRVWNIYHDAAIVKFPLEDGKTRDFIVVVMTNRIDFSNIKRLGAEIEGEFYGQENI